MTIKSNCLRLLVAKIPCQICRNVPIIASCLLPSQPQDLTMQEIPLVKDIMSTKVLTLRDSMTMETALRTLLKGGHSGAPVLNDRQEVCGMLSEKDCLRMFFVGMYDRLPLGKVRQYMSNAVTTCDVHDDIYGVARVFFQNSFRRLPVVDGAGRMVGIVSRRDVLNGSKRLWEDETTEFRENDDGYFTSEIKAAIGQSRRPRTEEVRSDIY